MPEGHSVHRIARQFARSFTGPPVTVSSPQGRFTAGADRLDGHAILQARAVGKQMFLEFDHHLWLRVHLGMYGAWDFAGDIAVGPISPAERGGRVVGANEDSPWSIGAPRRTRLRMAESERLQPEIDVWPPEPIGQVRVRLLTPVAVADLRGPTACAVQTVEEVDATIAKLGPDPLVDGEAGEDAFVANVRKRNVAIGQLLMDQEVVAGIGNVYRAELLFRARLDPYTPGKDIPTDVARELWRDWTYLLGVGVETGQMFTMDGLEGDELERAKTSRDDRHWVYHRTGEPCRVCGTPIAMAELVGRRLYWCPKDQV
ncbi:DNA-formamidopyrimidine glycosylase family protein [Pseudolysinimonas sp.]|uniref:Fpg/Nei family DNA glycosylase n=1 Tax=Pseudolysinimonas sp. TaxID=2680009 RepID=UPI00286D6826|nr:DNA-formamidopyrimidine glycosylase family protein [Pseudolysinimonas sp.]